MPSVNLRPKDRKERHTARTFLDEIITEVMEIYPAEFPKFEPRREPGEREHVVGVADDDLKRLYCLAVRWENAQIENFFAGLFADNPADREKYVGRVAELDARRAALSEIISISIKDSFDLWHKPRIGIRRGWKITWSDNGRANASSQTPDLDEGS